MKMAPRGKPILQIPDTFSNEMRMVHGMVLVKVPSLLVLVIRLPWADRVTQFFPFQDEVRKLATLLPRLQMFLARRQNTVATINNLPIEILAHIFKLTSTAEPDAHPAQCMIVLSLVCYHWRQTALGFPALWTTIHLREGAIHDFQLATLCLERSKDASLSVIISTLFRGEQISNFFLPYSSRIESVSIFIPFKCSSHDVPRILLSTCGFLA